MIGIRKRCAFAFAGILSVVVCPAGADEYRLEGATLPAPFLDAGQPDVVIEASGVEPIGDGGRFLVAHDKAPALHVVETRTGRLLGAPITSPKFPAPTKTGPKWEGMARDSDGNYYLIGAHNGKTDDERATKSVLLRFRLVDGTPPAIDEASVVRLSITRSLETAMKRQGLDDAKIARRKIEGLAIRESKGPNGALHRELIIGLREPGDKVRGYSANISGLLSPDTELELRPAFSFEADPREGFESQLTSLEYVPELNGLLVVTASEDPSNAFHGNTLWFLANGETTQARKVAVFEVAMKAEGLAVLGVDRSGRQTRVKLLITFDNDPHATKIPSRYQTVTLVRDAN